MRVRFSALVFIVFAVAFICQAYLSKARADTSSTWISSPSLSLDKIRDLAINELPPYSINGNRDCINQKVITRPGRLVPPQSEQSHQSCIVDTAYGARSASGYLQRQGTNVAGELRLNSGGLINLIAVPRSDTAIKMGSPGANGVSLFFIKNFGSVLKSSAIFTGEVTHKAPPDYTSALKDKASNLLWTQPDSMSFSTNGQWMIVDTSFIGTVRVNLETFEVLPFGPSYNYNVGLTPSIQSAISGDGRYAVLFSKSFSRFRLFDLSTCSVVPNTINGPANCQSRDLLPYFNNQLAGFHSISTVRFINNESLSLYATVKDGSIFKTAQYVLRLPNAPTFSYDYLALGDSYTSGEGAYQYKALTDTSDNKCHLSQRSYPYLIGQELALNKYESVACSGATIYDISNTDGDYEGQAKDKLAQGSNDLILASFNPGYIAQHEFTDRYKPAVITISAVGNDIGFVPKIKRCLLEPGTCFATYEDRLEIVRQANSQFNRLVDMYKQVKGDPRAKIYAIGYPQIVKPDGDCEINVLLSKDERIFTESLITYLNSVIKQAAAKVGVAYVDTEDALHGFRLCEPDSSWDVAVNGLTAGNDIIKQFGGPIGNESYHPTAFGQWLIKEKILEETAGFTQPMPTPNDTAAPPLENDSLPILQAARSGRAINSVNYDIDMGNDVMYRNGVWEGVMSVVNIALKPLSIFRAVLHSDPVDLGNFTSDINGNLSISFTVPNNAPAGFHTLHIYGKNVADEPVDIYKTVYVADNQTDYNGNGIDNEIDVCPFSLASNIDIDVDNVDDACDGFIGEPPVVAPPEPNPEEELPVEEQPEPPESSLPEDSPQPEEPEEPAEEPDVLQPAEPIPPEDPLNEPIPPVDSESPSDTTNPIDIDDLLQPAEPLPEEPAEPLPVSPIDDTLIELPKIPEESQIEIVDNQPISNPEIINDESIQTGEQNNSGVTNTLNSNVVLLFTSNASTGGGVLGERSNVAIAGEHKTSVETQQNYEQTSKWWVWLLTLLVPIGGIIVFRFHKPKITP